MEDRGGRSFNSAEPNENSDLSDMSFLDEMVLGEDNKGADEIVPNLNNPFASPKSTSSKTMQSTNPFNKPTNDVPPKANSGADSSKPKAPPTSGRRGIPGGNVSSRENAPIQTPGAIPGTNNVGPNMNQQPNTVPPARSTGVPGMQRQIVEEEEVEERKSILQKLTIQDWISLALIITFISMLVNPSIFRK